MSTQNIINLPRDSADSISSITISELVEKRHDVVKQSIERLVDKGIISLPPLMEVRIQRERRLENVGVYILGKRDSYIVVAQLSPEFTAKLVDRWQELEAKQEVKLPSTYAEALRELANTSEQNETLRLENTVLETEKTTLKVENTVLKPKADFYDTVTASDTVCSMAVAAQTAGLPFGQNILYQRLRGEGVLISGGSRHNLPMQRYVEQKLFTVKESTYPKTLGEIGVSFKCLVTQKGIDWLIKKYGDTKAQPELPLG